MEFVCLQAEVFKLVSCFADASFAEVASFAVFEYFIVCHF